MKTSPEGRSLIEFFEGNVLEAYPDPATKNDPIKKGKPWTIGVGHTGHEVVKGLKITAEESAELLEKDLEKFEKGVLNAVSHELSQNEFDALVAFAFNVGIGAMAGSTLMRKLNAGDTKGAAGEFVRWNKANGKVMRGLTRRRSAEASLFLGRDWMKEARKL